MAKVAAERDRVKQMAAQLEATSVDIQRRNADANEALAAAEAARNESVAANRESTAHRQAVDGAVMEIERERLALDQARADLQRSKTEMREAERGLAQRQRQVQASEAALVRQGAAGVQFGDRHQRALLLDGHGLGGFSADASPDRSPSSSGLFGGGGGSADGGRGGVGGPDQPQPHQNPFLPAGLYTGGNSGPTTTAPYFSTGLGMPPPGHGEPGAGRGGAPFATGGGDTASALEDLIRRAGANSHASTAPMAGVAPTAVPFGQHYANTMPPPGAGPNLAPPPSGFEKEMQGLIREGAENRRFIQNQAEFLNVAGALH